MIRFVIKKSGEVKKAFSAKENAGKIYIKFTENGKEYAYNKDKIEIIVDKNDSQELIKNELPFRVYAFKKQCYRCHKFTDIITYIKFADGNLEDLVYPWNKNRLMKAQSHQHILAHIQDPSIEYYGLIIVGDCQEYDDVLMKEFPNKISVQYSSTTQTSYPMNLCSHCGAQQGHYFVYKQVNEMIQAMQKIDILE